MLELGCGYNAYNLISLYDYCKSIVAVDFNLSNNLKALNKFRLIQSPIDSALDKISRSKFDVILILNVLEHLRDPQEVLNKSYKLLNDQGKLIILVPSWRGKFFLEFASFKLGLAPREEMNDHKMYYDLRDLWPMLVKAGFIPDSIKIEKYKFGLTTYAVCLKNEK